MYNHWYDLRNSLCLWSVFRVCLTKLELCLTHLKYSTCFSLRKKHMNDERYGFFKNLNQLYWWICNMKMYFYYYGVISECAQLKDLFSSLFYGCIRTWGKQCLYTEFGILFYVSVSFSIRSNNFPYRMVQCLGRSALRLTNWFQMEVKCCYPSGDSSNLNPSFFSIFQCIS